MTMIVVNVFISFININVLYLPKIATVILSGKRDLSRKSKTNINVMN